MLYGAIYGDILGSTHEYVGITGGETHNELLTNNSTFTDDTILTLAVADALINKSDIADALRLYATLYPHPMGGYGTMFVNWLEAGKHHAMPYNSYGNGSAMRCSACAWVANSIEEALELAKNSAEPTHNHPEGIIGAQATVACIYLSRKGLTKEAIRSYVQEHFYDMSRTYEDIYNTEPYRFHAVCQETVPLAINAFLYSHDFDSALLYAMLLDKDTDTIGAITGAIAEAFYGIPEHCKSTVRKKLNKQLLYVLDEFTHKYSKAMYVNFSDTNIPQN